MFFQALSRPIGESFELVVVLVVVAEVIGKLTAHDKLLEVGLVALLGLGLVLLLLMRQVPLEGRVQEFIRAHLHGLQYDPLSA